MLYIYIYIYIYIYRFFIKTIYNHEFGIFNILIILFANKQITLNVEVSLCNNYYQLLKLIYLF